MPERGSASTSQGARWARAPHRCPRSDGGELEANLGEAALFGATGEDHSPVGIGRWVERLLLRLNRPQHDGRRPVSASACRTHCRSASLWMPRSRATCAIGRSDSNTSRTARSRNSSEYFLGLAIAGASPSPRTEPGSGASRKSRIFQWWLELVYGAGLRSQSGGVFKKGHGP